MISKASASLLIGGISVVLGIKIYLNYTNIKILNQAIAKEQTHAENKLDTDIAFLKKWGLVQSKPTIAVINTNSFAQNIETLYQFLKNSPIKIKKIELNQLTNKTKISLHYDQ